MKTLYVHRWQSPVGELVGAVNEQGAVVRLDFVLDRPLFPPSFANSHDLRWEPEPCARLEQELCAYFAGTRREFTVPLAAEGTPFRQKVWAALTQIPFGTTLSYGELARRVGDPKASRAVGAANGSNPIAIIVPCHRVIGASGALTGYASGVDLKRALLSHEAQILGTALFPGAGLRVGAPPKEQGRASQS